MTTTATTTAEKPVVTAKLGKTGKSAFSSDIRTPIGRVSYPKIDKPDSDGEFADDKYKLTLLIPKDVDLSEMKQAAVAAARAMWGEKIDLKTITFPFKDGDKRLGKDGKVVKGFEGNIAINVKSAKKPVVVGPDKKALPADKEIYGGCYARLNVNAYTYTTTETVRQADGSKVTEESKGVAFGLNAVQFVRDGERFGGDRLSVFDEVDVVDSLPAGGMDDDDFI